MPRAPEDEEHLITEFKNRLSDVLRPEDDDYNLRKWLKARCYNLDQAEKMFRESRKFKDEMDIQNIRDHYKPPEVLNKYLPGGFCGYDKDGSPIKVELFGKLDMKGIMYSCKKSDLKKTKLLQCERTLDMWKEQSKKLNKTVDGLTVIFDMDGFSMGALWRPGIQMYLELVKILEDNYPEMMKYLLVINAPSIFPLVYNLCRPLVSEDMRKKIHVFGRGNYQDDLLKYIDEDQIPAFLGGTLCDPVDGGKECYSMICHGGKVPESWYLDKDAWTENMESKTIPSGKDYTITMDVDQPGSVIRWEYRTLDKDIGFELSRKCTAGSGSRNNTKEEILLPSTRVDTTIMAVEGSYVCDEPGSYKVCFDNKYSWTRSKKLYYLVEMFQNLSSADKLDSTEHGFLTRFVGTSQITHL